MEAAMAPISARIEMFPNALEPRLFSSGSRTMRSVAAMVRMISGRKRMVSAMLKPGLTGTRDLRTGPGWLAFQLDPDWHVRLRLLEHAGCGLADWRQERLRIDSHPDHHCDQRNHSGPLAAIE